MSWSFSSSVGSLRLTAMAVALVAIGILLQAPVSGPTPVTESADAASGSRVWSVRTDGWILRIDGADVALPDIPNPANAPRIVSYEVKLSPFDHVIKRHAAAQGFNWQLVAAVIFEESRFEPNSRSPKGAFGLMQVREIAADAVGEYRFKLPEDNIRTGVRYLGHLADIYAAIHERDRGRFILAAYNVGPGHLADAQTLADRTGFDRNRWDGGIKETLPLLEEERYYQTVPQGYAQGSSVIRYVDRVMDRYWHYQRLTAAATLEEIAAVDGASPPSASK
jgi:soluble lytic murein transglycosylase-like protein